MKFLKATTFAIAASLVAAVPAVAQQSGPALQAGETAVAYAQRVNACGGAGIIGAAFAQGQQLVQVRCVGAAAGAGAGTGMAMGAPGAAAAAGAAVVVVAVLASDSSSTTTSN
ncbi:MAG: hypothetical protein NXH74_03980 [Rhodobacteraceae bacterium]|jgi:hypothetical protein|nr:hypothetical protein [Paracoccaceae bacterium]